MKCTANCEKHGFIHGAEAEELRENIERLCGRYDKKVPISDLENLLRRVEARDSVAFLEQCVIIERTRCIQSCDKLTEEYRQLLRAANECNHLDRVAAYTAALVALEQVEKLIRGEG